MLRRPVGLLIALFALWVQLAAGTVLPHPPAAATLAELLGDPGAICHSGGGAEPSPQPHSMPDCPLCPVCATLIHAVPLPVAPPMVPQRRAGVIGHSDPPLLALLTLPVLRLSAQPRGPPVLNLTNFGPAASAARSCPGVLPCCASRARPH